MTLVERLRTKADTIKAGSRIGWGSDILLMREAAARIEALEEALQEQVNACHCDDCEMCHRHQALLDSTEGQP